eukprot:3335679-Amphidinium_carterae.1
MIDWDLECFRGVGLSFDLQGTVQLPAIASAATPEEVSQIIGDRVSKCSKPVMSFQNVNALDVKVCL